MSTLLYCLGEQAEAVLNSMNASDTDKAKYETVIAKLDEFFKVRKNVIFECARFNRRNQRDGESAEQYIMALYDLAENCEYGDLQSEMIRDCLVVGIRDAALSERLQTDAELTLEKAKKTIRQREAVHGQQRVLKGAEPTSLETVQYSRSSNRRLRGSQQQGGRSKSKTPSNTRRNKCTRCGKDACPREKCPSKDAECHRCKRKGHYGAMCFSKAVAGSVEAAADSMDVAFLDTLTPARQETSWSALIHLNSKQTPFKLDTGAEVTAINGDTR